MNLTVSPAESRKGRLVHKNKTSTHPLLTYICCSFGYGQVGAHAPGSAVVVLLAAAAVRPGGVVLALAAQLPLVEHAAVGVQVALAPETEGSRQKTDRQIGVRL